MEIQIIKSKPVIFRVRNVDYEFVKPYYLMPVDGMRMIKGVVKGSTLCWNIGGGVLTYNQISKCLKKNTCSL